MTTLVLIRLVLDYVDDLDEAVEIAKAYDMHDSAGTSYYYMAADASRQQKTRASAQGQEALVLFLGMVPGSEQVLTAGRTSG